MPNVILILILYDAIFFNCIYIIISTIMPPEVNGKVLRHLSEEKNMWFPKAHSDWRSSR
jgi:hypothetical protein